MQPTWPRLLEPVEKIVDRLSVVWGVVNHLKPVKDSEDLRSTIEEISGSICVFIALYKAMLRLQKYVVAFYGK